MSLERCTACRNLIVGDCCSFCRIMGRSNYSEAVRGVRMQNSPSQSSRPRVMCDHDGYVVPSGGPSTRICRVTIENGDVAGTSVTVKASIDGVEFFVLVTEVPGSRDAAVDVTVSSNYLKSEYVRDRDVCVEVLSEEGRAIFKQIFTVRVRPYIDIELGRISEGIARWVTPGSESIKALIRRGGPVMEKLEGLNGGFVSGYQGSGPEDRMASALAQMKAVYGGLLSLDLKYVSDTDSDGNNLTYGYQRVRTPEIVLRDGTGNCIELSCLFASVFEAMGLYPVILFPPGHAIAGILLSSKVLPEINGYRLDSGPPVFDLEETDIGDSTSDSLQAIFVECTSVCSGTGFDESLAVASEEVSSLERGQARFSIIPYARRFGRLHPIAGAIR